jgi:23S rRNA pseudouridine2457 synthase
MLEHRYFVINKPYEMISQFVSPYDQRLLGDLDYEFPSGTQAVGRLDFLSEGLLLLTNDRSLTGRLLHPSKGHVRTYEVLVRGIVSDATLKHLQTGVTIGVKGKGFYDTQACLVKLLEKPSQPERVPPYVQYDAHTWLEFTLTEGKNKQIRKMCKEVHHHCKRLIRTSIEDLRVDGLQPGEVREIQKSELEHLLKLTPTSSQHSTLR